jgi:peptide/nickel transport system permease protein
MVAPEQAVPEGRPARRRLPPLLPIAFIVIVSTMAVAPDLFTAYSPIGIDPAVSLTPPAFVSGGSSSHLLGTDQKGRDIASRLIFGARVAVIVVVTSLVLGGMIGIGLGMIAGYVGGWISALIMRLVEISLAFPTVLIALLASAVSRSGLWLVVGATAFVLWARFARLVRSDVLVWREREFIAMARVAGTPGWKILLTHLLPNLMNGIIVLATLQIGWIVILEASLSFLGAGIPAPDPSWGGMVAEGRPTLEIAWWIALMPSIAIALTVLSFNTLGDWLRDRLDPRLSQLA